MQQHEGDTDFSHMIRQVRAGDAEAAANLVQSYESELRIIARAKLNDPQLRRLVDSMDICQSILGNFFIRASAGQFDIESPEQLRQLLATMVRNKVTDHARRQKAGRRDMGRVVEHPIDSLANSAFDDTPSQIAEAKELAAEARNRMTSDELEIVDRRMNGLNWEQIALERATSPEAVRKTMKGAMDRVAKSFNLDS